MSSAEACVSKHDVENAAKAVATVSASAVYSANLRTNKHFLGVTLKHALRLLATAHRIGQVADGLFQDAIGTRALTPRQAQVLAAIAECEGMSQTQLVEATGIDRATLAAICTRLAKKGWVTRRRTREDTRTYALKLTPEGVAMLRRAERAAAHIAVQLRGIVRGLEPLETAPGRREAAE